MISPEIVQRATLILVMTAEQQTIIRQRFGRLAAPILLLGDLDPFPNQDRDIVDPWSQPPEIFETCYHRIDRCVHELASAVTLRPFGASSRP
jgi:protein-tyrosine-phosphatase